MNFGNPELIERLAGEYVLGTLHGAARARFERLLREREDVRRAVWRWESRLGILSTVIEPAVPPDSVWEAIERRIWPAAAAPSRGGLWQSLRFWRSWSALASAMAVALVLWLLQPAPIVLPPGPDHVALIGDSANPLWVIGANLETGELVARAVNAEAAELDKVFELWMLPESGPPQSIGLLPVSGASVSHELPAGLLALLRQSKGLAISIEPPGGSPTGLPTGPVVYTARILEL